LYNGNISQTEWKTKSINPSPPNNLVSTKYTYTYDALNRITSAIDNTNNYSLSSVTYDKNGNIMSLQRRGHLNSAATSFGVMDNLVYTYDSGNKLKKVLDNGNDTYGFKDGANVASEYTYDQNGNMKTDANKGITSIVYNHLNLPTEIKFNNSNTKKINYTYDASGTKLRKVVNDNGSITTTDYAGNYVYENNQLQFFNTAEGYVTKSGNNFKYVYQYKDHLGNVRLSYSDNVLKNGSIEQNEIIEESNYYPFGMIQKGYNTVVTSTNPAQDFKYNGKELQDELGLNLYDYHARLYDPALGRMIQIDPSAHKYSPITPYNYTLNSPLNFVDPDGKDFRLLIRTDEDGNIHLTIQTTINTYGNQSSENAAKDLKNRLEKLFKGGNFGKDGKNTLSFDFDVKHFDKKEDAIKATKDNAGDNLLELTDESVDSGFNLYTDSKSDKNKKFGVSKQGYTIVPGGRESKAIDRNYAIHEIGHLLGLGDRYRLFGKKGEEFGISDPGFLHDIMGNNRSESVSPVHYNNLYQFVSKDVKNRKKDTRTIIYTNIGFIPEKDRNKK
jgi:RHS repeat-associated protein